MNYHLHSSAVANITITELLDRNVGVHAMFSNDIFVVEMCSTFVRTHFLRFAIGTK
ncbi:MAG: hypothetical protein RIB71_20675 [Imperialibacter sp.]|uniref:hypothetical protein n=1 Tax=Imperialibacter sp. TaxID=2038411 RepID=UPI0032EAF777